MEASCMQLSIEGERLLKAHDYEGAITFFEGALREGTDDMDVLSAIYNQIGNAYFYVGKFHKALEYHKKDLEIAEKQHDRQGMAKAYGNLGNTFKSLKNYPHAIRCCESHLEITRELKDRLGEGRACYNLGNVHHALGKALMQSRDQAEQSEGRKSILTAIEYYKTTLTITAELSDVAGEGRAVGNLGNAYTAIGEYAEAIKYHLRRLKIAQDSNDLPARARACGNLGNAYSALSDFSEAIKYYQQSLNIAKESNNKPSQAQAHYCLGSTYALLKNHVKAIEHHEQHLAIATEVGDKSGQLRGWFNLRNSYHALGDTNKVIYYHKLIQQHQGGQPPPPLPSNNPNNSQHQTPHTPTTSRASPQPEARGSISAKKDKKEDKGLLGKIFGKKGPKDTVEAFSVEDSDDDDDLIRVRNQTKGKLPPSEPKVNKATEWLNDAIKQASIDEPRHDASAEGRHRHVPDNAGEGSSTLPGTDFFDMLVGMQGTRLDDQRSPAPRISLNDGAPVASGPVDLEADESFFDMLVAMQSTRLEDQRSPAPRAPGSPRTSRAQSDEGGKSARNLDQELDENNMSFFEMLAVAKSNN